MFWRKNKTNKEMSRIINKLNLLYTKAQHNAHLYGLHNLDGQFWLGQAHAIANVINELETLT